jgi:hypothetical protein
LADALVKIELETKAEARAEPVTSNRLFSDGEENSRKPDSSEKEGESFCVECAKPYSVSRDPAINWSTIFMPDSATFSFQLLQL